MMIASHDSSFEGYDIDHLIVRSRLLAVRGFDGEALVVRDILKHEFHESN